MKQSREFDLIKLMKTRTSRKAHIRSYRKAGETWYKLAFSLAGHQIRKRGFATYEEAEIEYLNIRKKIRSGEWANFKAHSMTSMTLSEMYEVYCSSRGNERAPATVEKCRMFWRSTVDPVIGAVRVKDFSRRTLASFVRELRLNGLTDNTISRYKAEINNVLRLAVEFEVLASMPTWPKLKAVPEKKELLSPEEVLAVINAVDKGEMTHQYRTMIRLQYECALRAGELVGLQVGKIDLERRTILIDQQKLTGGGFRLGPTKTKTAVVLPLSPNLVEELRPYVEQRVQEAPLFVSSRLLPVSRNAYDYVLRSAVKSAGLQKNISSHCLRASCLDWLVNHTSLSIMAVSHFARHSPKMLVSHYAQVDHDVLNDFFGSKKSLEEGLKSNVIAITGTDDP